MTELNLIDQGTTSRFLFPPFFITSNRQVFACLDCSRDCNTSRSIDCDTAPNDTSWLTSMGASSHEASGMKRAGGGFPRVKPPAEFRLLLQIMDVIIAAVSCSGWGPQHHRPRQPVARSGNFSAAAKSHR